jgi:competence protein ComEA
VVERVPGIGPGNAARLSQGGLTVAGAAYAGAPAAAPDKPAKAGKPIGDKASERSAAPKS